MAEPARAAAGAPERRFLTFRIAGRLYALPADKVVEVIRVPPLARVPQGPRGLLGLANLRGAVIPVASARGLLGREEEAAGRAIVLDGPAPVALAVDRVEKLVVVPTERIEVRQAELAAEPGERLRGAFQTEDGAEAAKVLDVWPLLEGAFVQAPRAPGTRASGASGRTPDLERVQQDAVGRLVTFDLGGQEFALPLDAVQEIIPAPANVVSAPRAEAVLLGVGAHRDRLLPLLSLRGLLGLPMSSEAHDLQKVLVTRVGGALVGLVVDRMREIVPADPALLEPTPPMLAARTGGESRIQAIYRGEGGRRLISVLAPDQLFREDVMARLGGTLTDQAAAEPVAHAETRRLLVFRLGDEEFGLPIEVVDEVVRAPEQVTRVPKAPRFLDGVINLRGEVLPVIDQRRRFDMPPSTAPEGRRLIVVRTERHRAGVIVDAVSEVLQISVEAVEPAPHLTGETTRLVQGVINLAQAGRLILLLDPAELLTRAERGLLDKFQADRSRTGS